MKFWNQFNNTTFDSSQTQQRWSCCHKSRKIIGWISGKVHNLYPPLKYFLRFFHIWQYFVDLALKEKLRKIRTSNVEKIKALKFQLITQQTQTTLPTFPPKRLCGKTPHIPPLKMRKPLQLKFLQSPNHKIPRDTMEFCDRKFKGLGFALTSSVAWLSGIRSTPKKITRSHRSPLKTNGWNLKIHVWKRRNIDPNHQIFGFHVCFRGCNQWQLRTEQISHLQDARLSIFSS